MKCGLRITLCAILLAGVTLYLLGDHLRDLGDQYRAGAYLNVWWNKNELQYFPTPPQQTSPGDKVIVMAKLEEEPTEWVEEELPEYVTGVGSTLEGSTPLTQYVAGGNEHFTSSTLPEPHPPMNTH